ncbi:MAG: gamma carbonic anhydrase family protein [Candidatus Velthaea sp.]|jgi:carbonic anhydrase/acetyltransferase-like protein (isoleucine patch superfamily)
MPFYSIDDVRPTVPDDEDYWVAPNATLIGHVRLERAVGIWFGAVLRADNDTIFIGAGSNVQDNCVLHADPGFPVSIGEYCTIGHHAIVHGCSVGDNSLIGMGATVLNGARIGRNCLVAANALVSENVVIPDNSLVRGIPGKVAGTIDDDRARSMRLSAEEYIRAWRRYRQSVRPIELL